MAYKPTVDELAQFMNRTFSGGQQAAASPIIDGLAAQARRHLPGKALEADTIVGEEHVLEWGQDQVFFRQVPVVSIDALEVIAVDGVTITELDPADFVRRRWGLSGLRNSGGGETLRVTYTVAAIPDDDIDAVHGVLLGASARIMGARVLADAHGATSLAVEGTSYVFGPDELVLTDSERAALPARRPRGR